jgi:tetratricopeptide (TPR) repeat protein
LYPGLAALALILILPYFVTNLGYNSSVDYYKWLMEQDKSKSKSGMVALRDYYTNIGETKVADSINNEIWNSFAMTRIVTMVSNLTNAERLDEALAIADSAYKANPYSKEVYNMRGLLYMRMGNFEKAIADLEMLTQLGRYDSQAFVNLASAYFRLGNQDLMWKNVRIARELNPNGSNVLQALAMAFILKKEYDSSLVYAERLLRADSAFINGYFAAGISCYGLGDFDRALSYLTRFMEKSPRTSDYQRAQHVLEQLKKTGSQND